MPDRSVNPNQSPRHPPPEVGHPVDRRLFAAASLTARKGLYAEASQLLRQAREANECSDAEALDLQARICAQQGMLVRAEACWLEALRHDPGNTAYVDAIARLRHSHDPLQRARARLLIFGAVAVAVAGLLFAVAGYRHIRQGQEDMADKVVRLESSLNDLRTAHADAQRSNSSQFDAIGKDIRQSQADTVAAIGKLPTSTQIDDQYRKLLAVTQAAQERIATDIKERDERLAAERKEDRATIVEAIKGTSDTVTKQMTGQLAKLQADFATTMKLTQDQQAANAAALKAQIEQSTRDIATLKADSAAGMDALDKRLDRSVSDIQRRIASIRGELDRFLWFRLPSSSDKETDHETRTVAPTTTSSK